MIDNQTEKQKVQELTDKDVELTMMDAQKQIDALQDSETEINKSQEQQEASDARKAAQLLHGSMDKYCIYQLKDNPELDKFRFEGTESLKRMGITKYDFDTIVPENYEQVYMGELSEFRGRTQGETLEAIYTKFNIDHPADYKAQIENFKNVNYGDVRLVNYANVQYRGNIAREDINGIYGQNGSGKTAVIKNRFQGQLHLGDDGLPETTKAGKGHGIGLNNIRRVARMYMGDISMEQENGEVILSILMQVE